VATMGEALSGVGQGPAPIFPLLPLALLLLCLPLAESTCKPEGHGARTNDPEGWTHGREGQAGDLGVPRGQTSSPPIFHALSLSFAGKTSLSVSISKIPVFNQSPSLSPPHSAVTACHDSLLPPHPRLSSVMHG
jgi:hypothetical protein